MDTRRARDPRPDEFRPHGGSDLQDIRAAPEVLRPQTAGVRLHGLSTR
jgi:hypothetical protein